MATLHKSIYLLILYMEKLKYTDIEQFAKAHTETNR